MTVRADVPKLGMSMEELTTVLARARTAGFTVLERTQVGFKGQIIEMRFGKRPLEHGDDQ